MKISNLVVLLALAGSVGAWVLFGYQPEITPPSNTTQSQEPKAPDRIGEERHEISPNDPAPPLYVQTKTQIKPETSAEPRATQKQMRAHVARDPKSGPELERAPGVVNPDAITYYRKAGLLGASSDALAVLGAQDELWQPIKGTGGLGFKDTSGDLSLAFEVNERGAVDGAVVEVAGGGAGARLMTVEMWMTGGENPWNLYWEQERPGPIAGRVSTPDQQEVHYYCDMVAMTPEGGLMEPSRCHFTLNRPTPEELAYRQIKGAAPLRPAESRP